MLQLSPFISTQHHLVSSLPFHCSCSPHGHSPASEPWHLVNLLSGLLFPSALAQAHVVADMGVGEGCTLPAGSLITHCSLNRCVFPQSTYCHLAPYCFLIGCLLSISPDQNVTRETPRTRVCSMSFQEGYLTPRRCLINAVERRASHLTVALREDVLP